MAWGALVAKTTTQSERRVAEVLRVFADPEYDNARREIIEHERETELRNH
jgi:hypothetical protein